MSDFDPVEIRIDFQQNVDTEGKKATEGINDVAAASNKLRQQMEKDITAQKTVIDKLVQEIKDLQATMAKPVKTGDEKQVAEKQKLIEKIDLLNKKLLEQQAILDKLQSRPSTGGGGTLPGLPKDPAAYAKGMNQLGFSMQQVARELPSLAMSPQMFFLAISNNLPILQDQIRKTRIENEALKKSGQTFTPVWKTLLGSLFSWQTALVAGITILTVYGKEIFGAIGKMLNFSDATKLTKEELKSLTSELSKNLGSEIGKLDAAFDKLKKAKEGTEAYGNAKKAILDQYGQYLKGLDNEITKLNDVEGAYRAIAAAVKDQAREKILTATMSEQADVLWAEKIKQYEAIRKEFISKFGDKLGDTFFTQLRKELESGNGLSYEMKRIVSEFTKTETRITPGTYGQSYYTVEVNSVRQSLDELGTAQDIYNKKVREAQKLLGDLFGGGGGSKIKSLISEQETLLEEAKLMPESTEAEIAAKNRKIQAIEDEIKRLKELGKINKKNVDETKELSQKISELYDKLRFADGADRDEIARKILELENELRLRKAIAENAVKAVRNEEVPKKLKPIAAKVTNNKPEKTGLANSKTALIDWLTVFSDLDKVSTDALIDLRDKLKKYLGQIDDNISKDDFKEITEAFNAIDNAINERQPISSISDAIDEYKYYTKKLEAQKQILEQKKKEGASDAEILKAEKDILDTENDRAGSLSKMSKGINEVGRKGSEIVSAMSEFTDMLENYGVNIGESGKEIMNGVGQMMNGLESIDFTRPFTIVTGSIKFLAGIGNTIAGILGGGRDEISQSVFDHYEDLMTTMNDVIAKQKELLNAMSGQDAVSQAEKGVELINKQIEATKNLGTAYLASGDSWKSHSYGYKLNKSLRGFTDDLKAIGIDLGGHMEKLFDLSPEQLRTIKEEIPEAWASIDDVTRGYLQTIIDAGEELDGMKESLKETLTGISFDSAKNSLKELLSDADTTMSDVASNFEDYMRDAILGVLIDGALQTKIKEWYDDFADAIGDDGILDSSEKDKLQKMYNTIYSDAVDMRDAAYSAAGIDINDTSRTASSKGIAQASQDSVDELNGRMTAIQSFIYDIRSYNAQSLDLDRETALYQDAILGRLDRISDNTEFCRYLLNIKQGIDDINLKGVKIKS